jgi:hypothetical protein
MTGKASVGRQIAECRFRFVLAIAVAAHHVAAETDASATLFQRNGAVAVFGFASAAPH